MKIYLATNNEHKRQELSQILKGYTILIPNDFKLNFNPVENGKSFFENALIKARALYDIVKSPTLADDSGLCVDILDGKPGIHSSRYAGINFPHGKEDVSLSAKEKNLLLIEHINTTLKSSETTDTNNTRSARFVCCLVLYLGCERFFSVQESLEGKIVQSFSEARGSNGFGYDPIFFLSEYNKTLAELSEEEKNKISHRGKATRAFQKLLQDEGLNASTFALH